MQQEQFDIVHSHARIPNVIIHTLKKRFRFGFVSTLHFAFTKNTLVKKFTVWGDKCLVVSEDLKRHLIRNSRMKTKDITITVNGINKRDFCGIEPDSALMKELGIRENSKKIVCVPIGKRKLRQRLSVVAAGRRAQPQTKGCADCYRG